MGIIGDKKYTLADVDRAIQSELRQLDEERYRKRKAFLDEKLIALEASSQGLTPKALIRKEVYDKIRIEPEEVQQFISDNRSRLPGSITPNITRGIENRLRQEKMPAGQSAYVERLKEKYGVQFSIPLPQRVDIETNPRGGPVKGPADAPVTIIVFTDFECPFCRKAHQSLNAIMERFPRKIRLAFRHFPLAMHRWSGQAAEMAWCAQQQERFWPFADRVFSNKGKLSPGILHEDALKAGIKDMAGFDECLRSGRGKKQVDDDIAEGKRLGIDSTPALFINGRFFYGMPKDIDAIIREEIAKEKNGYHKELTERR